MSRLQLTVVTGLAIFAMFFGAGNMVFPLHLGVVCGEHLFFALFGFLVTGVGIPLLGMYTVILYGGDYQDFFAKLSRPVAAVVIFFIMALIGPFFAVPRTAIIAYHTMQDYLPNWLDSAPIFGIAYFCVVFAAIVGSSTVVNSIGRYISPVKISAFVVLVVLAIVNQGQTMPAQASSKVIFQEAFFLGYGTMDLLAAFFFAQAAYQNIVYYVSDDLAKDPEAVKKILGASCVLGAMLIGLVYTGMMIAAHLHAKNLAGIATENIISHLAQGVFNDFGSMFVCSLVLLASIATAIALMEVVSVYVSETLSQGRLSKNKSLLLCVSMSYAMSILGFESIIQLAMPVLQIVYPALILYCVVVGLRIPFLQRLEKMFRRCDNDEKINSTSQSFWRC